MSKRIAAFLLVCVLALGGAWFFRSQSQRKSAPLIASQSRTVPEVPTVTGRPRFAGAETSAPRRAVTTDKSLQSAAGSLRQYQRAFKENPIGSNAEITSKLLGQNALGLRLMPEDAPVNARGELVDQWNQPLFFHQISARLMEVRSAGPDHRMWNSDDEILR